MSELIRKSNQNMSDLDRARQLRQEAELLEQKARVRARLRQLLEISKDPCYDQYLEQMIKDLENGRATPFQVDREAQRSYNQYRQRMAHMAEQRTPVRDTPQPPQPPAAPPGMPLPENTVTCDNNPKDNMEFKIGVHVFSVIGAVFVLAAFVIFGFNFLSGLAQGLCLYGAALLLVVLSELILQRKTRRFSHEKMRALMRVLTGTGIGGLYAANIINYLVLRTISGFAAMGITLLIAAGAVLIGRKRDSTAIRLISLAGCYFCFLPFEGIETELNFLVTAVMLFIVNTVYIFIENQKNQTVTDSIHLLLNVIFTIVITNIAWTENTGAVYLVFYIATSFIFVSIFSLKKCAGRDTLLYPFSCIGNGIYIFLLFLVGNFGPGIKAQPDMALFVHLTAEALIAAVCGVVFLLWNREDGRKWAQLYYAVCTVLLLGSFSEYHPEIILSVLTMLLVTKLAAGQKEIIVLDCIVTAWAGLAGFCLADHWYCWLFAGTLILSALRIKKLYIYHETAVTLSLLLIWSGQCLYYYRESQAFEAGWFYPVSAGILLFLFLLFNHLPGLKEKKQQYYNVANVIFMVLYYLGVWFCDSSLFSSIMMALGAVTIIVVFRKRYDMAIPGKYLVLEGFLTYFTLAGHYESPVTVSILLMAIALVCVGLGFKMHNKAERICGLVLAAFVCLKLVACDFREVETIYRVVVFFVVGIIALVISYIYVQLEKNAERQKIQETL